MSFLKSFFFFLRPLAGHLLIYKVEYSSFFSILHRVSGSLLGFFLFLFILCYYFLNFFCNDFFFSFVLYFVPFSLLYIYLFFYLFFHFINGVRHIFWDLGFGFSKNYIVYSANFMLFCTFLFLVFVLI